MWVDALEQRDTKTLDCILDPTFADTNWRGQLVPKAEIIKALPGRPESTIDVHDTDTKLIGKVAIFRGINTQTVGTKIIGSVRFVDVFVYRSGRWQAVSAQETVIAR